MAWEALDHSQRISFNFGFRLILIRLIINFPLWLLNEIATNDNVPDSGNLNTRGGDSKRPWRPNPAETAV